MQKGTMKLVNQKCNQKSNQNIPSFAIIVIWQLLIN